MRIASLAVAAAAMLSICAESRADDRLTYAGHKWVKVDLTNPAEWDRFMSLTKESWTLMECNPGTYSRLDVEVSPEEQRQLDEWGFAYEVVVDDLGPLVANNYEQGAATAFFDDYRTLDQIAAQVNSYIATYPDLAHPVDIGTSLQGRHITGMRLTSAGGPPNKPIILYHGGQHAREWINVPVPMYVADWLLTHYGIDPQATRLLDNAEWVIIPVMNPDGYDYTWTNDRMWRKNRRNNGGGSFGVDLNRNWGYGWGGEGSSSDPNSEIYRGTAAFSEPETQVMRDFIVNNSRIRAYLDYHSYSQLVMYPWGYTSARCPDDAEFDDLTTQMADLIKSVHGMTYLHGPVYTTIYPAAGVSVDWVYGGNLPGRKIMAVTIELRDTGQWGFLLPKEQIIPTCEENLPAALAQGDWVSQILDVHVIGKPDIVPPGQSTVIQATVDERNDTFSGDISLYYRFGTTGNFTEAPMTLSGGTYRGTIPGGTCGKIAYYYVTAVSDSGIPISDPSDAPSTTYSYQILETTIPLSDDFQTNKGWTVQNSNLSDGAWERGVPVDDGVDGDPTTDYDGSGMCYLTGNRTGNSDVDGGPTYLISPTFDCSDGQDYRISYARWFSNDDRDGDRFTTEISNNNGSSWLLVESVGHTGAWVKYEFRVADVIHPTSTMKVRFGAVDNPNNSLTEAGLDAFMVRATRCTGGNDVTCGDVKKLVANCKASGKIIGKVVLKDTSHDGATVTLAIDGTPYDVVVSGRAAKTSDCCYVGTHTISLENPGGCVSPKQTTCP